MGAVLLLIFFVFQCFFIRLVKSKERQEKEECTLEDGKNVPCPEELGVEAGIAETYLIEARITQQLLLRILPIVGAKPADRHSCEKDVVRIVEVNVVDLRS